MPAPHNHEEWLACRNKQGSPGNQGKNGCDKRCCGQFERKGGRAFEKAPSKLALSESLKTTLVTQFSMTPGDADSVFEKCYSAAQSKDSGKE